MTHAFLIQFMKSFFINYGFVLYLAGCAFHACVCTLSICRGSAIALVRVRVDAASAAVQEPSLATQFAASRSVAHLSDHACCTNGSESRPSATTWSLL